MLFRKKENKTENESYPYGFAIPEQPDTVCSQRVLVCLIKGLLIFAAAYGTVGAVISSFSLPCYNLVLALMLLFFSVIMAFLHYSRFIFNLFYPVIFVGFTYFIFTFRFMVNSGYQAFVNILQQTYGDYYLLDIYRESTEFFSDRAMTITYAAGFIGFFLILLLNIFISEYMSPVAVILMTFPIFQMGIFVEKMPSMFYLVLLLFSYFMVGILRCSRHFLLPYRDKKWTEFKKDEKDNVLSYRYHASGRIFWQLTLLFSVFTLVIGIICLPMMSSSTNTSLSEGRKKMDEYMKTFTHYVPYSYNMLYLKAYTGCDYTGHSWDAPVYKNKTLKQDLGESYEDYESFTAFMEGSKLAAGKKDDPERIRSLMRIDNLDAETGYYYLPYYVSEDFNLPHSYDHSVIYPLGGTADLTDDMTNLTGMSPTNENAHGGSYSFYYYPMNEMALTVREDMPEDKKIYEDYYSMLNGVYYTEIPESLKDYLNSLHSQIGTGKDLNEQIQLIEDYLSQFPYSQTPGTTPMNEDFVRYFLETQKRGYCAHFASAGALLLRSYGYPARYVEGYAVSLADVAEGVEVEDADYDKWFDGKNPLGRTGVVSVNVTDGSAHAWVEVYDDNFGWIPCEFTPPSEDDDRSEAYSGFWDIFSGLFAISGRAPKTVDNQSQTGETMQNTANKLNSFLTSSVFRPLIIFVSFLIAIFVIYSLVRLLSDRIRMMMAWNSGDHSRRLLYHYRRICHLLTRKGLIPSDKRFLLPEEFADIYCELILRRDNNSSAKTGKHVIKPDKDVMSSASDSMVMERLRNEVSKYMDILNAALYSEHGTDTASAEKLLVFLKDCRKTFKSL